MWRTKKDLSILGEAFSWSYWGIGISKYHLSSTLQVPALRVVEVGITQNGLPHPLKQSWLLSWWWGSLLDQESTSSNEGSVSSTQLNLLSSHGSIQQTCTTLVTNMYSLKVRGIISLPFATLLWWLCSESAGAEGGLGTGTWSDVIGHFPWAIGQAHKFWSLLKAIPYKQPFPVHSSSPWLGLCAHTHVMRGSPHYCRG